MDGINKHVLFYSTRCQYSVKLLNIIEEKGMTSSFTKINIDFTDDIPKFVTSVPTVLAGKTTKISGQAVFEWLQKLTEETTLQPASINEMSDPYSFISDSGEKHIHTSYSLLDCDYGGGPSAGRSGGGTGAQTFAEPNKIQNGNNDDLMQRIVDSRKNEVPQMVRRV